VRLPTRLFQMLCERCEPQVFGLTYAGYETHHPYLRGMVHLHVTDREKFQQTVHGLQESGAKDHIDLLARLTR